MDLLKAISRDHLVLLVTHEANLVDYYCDTVIELSDGQVVATRDNADADGFVAKDKNDIYLGELQKQTSSDQNTDITYYGDAPGQPIRLTIVNHGGKLYARIDSAGVQLLDSSSEVKLREGVFERKARAAEVQNSIDMSSLPPVGGEHFGRLFSLPSSIKSGYLANFREGKTKGKKGKKLLRGCMCLFAAVIVLMSAIFGTAFGDIIDAKNAYNHNTFYVYTPDGTVSDKIFAAMQSGEGGIDAVYLTGRYPYGDQSVSFRLGSFETFTQGYYSGDFSTNAVYLDMALAENYPLVAGKRDDLAPEDILITTKVADALLEISTLGYISEPKDLIGLLTANGKTVDGKSLRIAGIVDCDESAVYLGTLAMASHAREGISFPNVERAQPYGMDVESGETVLIIAQEREDVTFPQVGETVRIHGMPLKVKEIKRAYFEYDAYLEGNGIKKMNQDEYITAIVREQHPELVEGTQEWAEAWDAACAAHYYDYYDYYHDQIDAFLKEYLLFEMMSLDAWLYVEKGVQTAKFLYTTLIDPVEYYQASVFREQNGRYPLPGEMHKTGFANLGYDPFMDLKQAYLLYEEEFYKNHVYQEYMSTRYLLSDEDYVNVTRRLGETHASAYNYYGGDIDYDDGVVVYPNSDSYLDYYYYGNMIYSVLHSSDPEATAAWLAAEFADLQPPEEYFDAVITPDVLFEGILANNIEGIVGSLITMAIILTLMSVCMYFIMRSSLMNRIKEVGIWRAIGVSRKNLLFKFLIEAVVLATLTVFPGYLATGGFLWLSMSMSSLVKDIFFYPLWLAAAVLVVLYGLSLFFGVLPVLTLLRKTPSEILAKYDI